MIKNDVQLGKPKELYTDTKANIEAIGSPVAGMMAFASDELVTGIYDGSSWIWQGLWLSYTPTWTAATTNPAIGNGTLVGQYTKIAKTIIAEVTLVTGSTTTYGTGDWSFSLPFSVPVQPSVYNNFIGSGYIRDVSAGTSKIIVPRLQRYETKVTNFYYDTGYRLSATAPMTWASGDSFVFGITYNY